MPAPAADAGGAAMTSDNVCSACGDTNPAGTTFCATCSDYLGWDEARPTRRPAPPAEPVAHAPVDPRPESPVATATRPRSFLWDDPISHRRLAAAPAAIASTRTTSELFHQLPGRGCPECGRANGGERRFCGKCGYRLRRSDLPDDAQDTAAAEQLSWWRRWWRTTDLATSPARRQFRHALPRSYRLRRWMTGLLVAALMAGGAVALVHNPVSWAKARWSDLTGSLDAVSQIQAQVEPASAVLPQYAAGQAVDGRGDTAWGLAWNTKSKGGTGCVGPSQVPPKGTAVLRLLLPQPATVRKVVIYAGLAADDPRRLHQWRPKTVDLGFSDGSCHRITLDAGPDAQSVTVTPTPTDEITLSVVDTYPAPADAPDNTLAISEVQVWQRPS